MDETPCRHPGLYFCPAAQQNECPACGGFDVCCSAPEGHGEPKLALDGVTDDGPVIQWHLDRMAECYSAARETRMAEARWQGSSRLERSRLLRVDRIGRRIARRAERST